MAETKIIGGTPSGTTFGVPGAEMLVDSTFGAGRVKLQPSEFANQGVVGGHFQLAQVTGLATGIAAAGPILSMRWAPPNGGAPLLLLKRLQVGFITTTAFTTAQGIAFDVIRLTGFTAADTGGTALAPIVGNKTRNQIMSASAIADLRIASTAALGAGTATADGNPFGYAAGQSTGVGTSMQLADLYNLSSFGQHPQVFGPNEGFRIRNVFAMGAAGVLNIYVAMTWAEVPGV